MPIRAYLVLHRMRLIWCVVIALLIPIFVVLSTASEHGFDLEVFWNHFCGCTPGKGDNFALLYASTFTAFLLGTLLSPSANAYAPTAGTLGFRSGIPYTLTRPMQRSTALFAPAVIAFLAIVILPAAGFSIVFGWMRLVHAPALAFFLQALRLAPDVAVLPTGASLLSLLVAAHAISIYLASVSIGLFAYVLFSSQRWFMLSRHTWVRVVGSLQTTVLFIAPVMLRGITPRVVSWLFLIPLGQSPAWRPSVSLLLIHYAIPAALMLCAWRTLQASDL